MATDATDRYRAPALDKGLDILELLAATERSLSQAEIAKSLNRSSNEIYRMLDRLVRRDYVRRTSEDRFELTLKLFELANKSPFTHRLIAQATPVLCWFSRVALQACHLVIYDRNALVVVAQVDAPGLWSIAIRVGGRMDLVSTGSGRVLLAFASPEDRQTMLEDQDGIDISELPADFEEKLEQVRERGFERIESQFVVGVTNLTVPILGPMGTVIAVLTCPFVSRLEPPNAPDMDKVLKLLIQSGKDISQYNP